MGLITRSLNAAAEQATEQLAKRQYYGYYGGYRYNSGWYNYGRWILLGVIVGLAVLCWMLICCCNRRRTRSGMQPYRYTAWATPGFQHPQQTGTVQGAYGQQGGYPQQPMQQTGGPHDYEYQQHMAMQQQQGQGMGGQAGSYYNAPGTAPPTYPQQTYSAVGGREK